MDPYLAWAIILMVAGIGVIVLEAFLPSGGLLSILAAGCFIGSLFCAFRYASSAGVILLLAEVLAIPATLIFVFRRLPKTRWGKKIMLTPTELEQKQQPLEQQPQQPKRVFAPPTAPDATSVMKDYSHLLGKEGIAITMLRPAGKVEIDSERYSVLTQGEIIEAGTKVRVIEVEGSHIVVEAVNQT